MCQQKSNIMMDSLTVMRRERSLSPCSVKSEPCKSVRMRSASSRRSSTPTATRVRRSSGNSTCSPKTERELVIPDIKIEMVENNTDTCTKEDNSATTLNGAIMVQFYNLWNRKQRTKPLGRGKTELPNAFLRQSEYRQCGCKSRNHSAP
ncbi:hypothetical protein ACF0H5_006991 [Mactra antiquata]